MCLNAFGLPLYLSWRRLSRLTRELQQHQATAICLQEIHQNAYVPLLQRGLPNHPYHAFEKGAFAPRGGLFTAARVSLSASRFVGYENRGRFLSRGVADWALGKGVLISALRVWGREVVLLNTHLHANYAGNWEPRHPLARLQRDQVRHLARLVREQPGEALILVCGDFNFPRGSFLYDELLAETGLTDPLAQDARPTFRPLPPLARDKWALPVDFCLMRRPVGNFAVQADIVDLQNSHGRFPHTRFLSDHNALTLHVIWSD